MEAAAFHGRPVYLSVFTPRGRPSRQTDSRTPVGVTGVILTVVFFGGLLAALVVARYNLNAGRGDTKGAFKLAVFIFLAILLARLIDADHVPELGGGLWLYFQSVSSPVFSTRLLQPKIFLRRAPGR